MTTTLQITVPNALLELGIEPAEIQRRAVEWLVLSLFTRERISSGKAARLLGIHRLQLDAADRGQGLGRGDLVVQPQAIQKLGYHETVVTGRDEGGARREVTAADWIEVVAVQDRLAVEVLLDELDLGEAETIILARQLNAAWVLMDEKKGRRKLQQLNIPKVGTLECFWRPKRPISFRPSDRRSHGCTSWVSASVRG